MPPLDTAGLTPLDTTGLKPVGGDEPPALDTAGLNPLEDAGPEPTGNELAVQRPRLIDRFEAELGAGRPSPLFGLAKQAALKGAREGMTDVANAPHPFTDSAGPVPPSGEELAISRPGASAPAPVAAQPEPQQPDAVDKLLQTPLKEGWDDPAWWTAQMAYGTARASPSLAAGIAGGAVGERTAGPVGAIAGGAAGFGLGSMVQEIAPAYQRARQEGLDHDAAVDRAIKETGVAGAFGTAMGVAPGVTFFGRTIEGALKRPISEALAQIFGVQPGLGVAQHVTTNEIEGKETTPTDLAQTYATNAGTGAVLVGAHHAIRSVGNARSGNSADTLPVEGDVIPPGAKKAAPGGLGGPGPTIDSTATEVPPGGEPPAGGSGGAAAQPPKETVPPVPSEPVDVDTHLRNLTPDDHASPIPDRLIAEGRAILDHAAGALPPTTEPTEIPHDENAATHNVANRPPYGGPAPIDAQAPGGISTETNGRSQAAPAVTAPGAPQRPPVRDAEAVGRLLDVTGLTAAPPEAGTPGAPVHVRTAADLERATARAESEPTQPQSEAGNYRMGHIRLPGGDGQSLDITIERPRGSERTGTRPDGSTWSVRMPAAYGYIKRSEGADGEHFDVYVGQDPQSPRAYVVDQIDPKTGKFDEHKGLIGFPSREAAIAAYDAAFSDGSGPSRRGAVTDMPIGEFRDFVHHGDTTKPLAYDQGAEPESAAHIPAAPHDAERAYAETAVRSADREGRLTQDQRRLAANLVRYGMDSAEAVRSVLGNAQTGIVRETAAQHGIELSEDEARAAANLVAAGRPPLDAISDVAEAAMYGHEEELADHARRNDAGAQWQVSEAPAARETVAAARGPTERLEPGATAGGQAPRQQRGSAQPGSQRKALDDRQGALALPTPPAIAPAPGIAVASGTEGKLFVEIGSKRYEVASIEDASRRFAVARDKAFADGAGSADLPQPLIVDSAGKVIANISQNGRVWPGKPGDWKPGAKPIYDPLPSAPAEPASQAALKTKIKKKRTADHVGTPHGAGPGEPAETAVTPVSEARRHFEKAKAAGMTRAEMLNMAGLTENAWPRDREAVRHLPEDKRGDFAKATVAEFRKIVDAEMPEPSKQAKLKKKIAEKRASKKAHVPSADIDHRFDVGDEITTPEGDKGTIKTLAVTGPGDGTLVPSYEVTVGGETRTYEEPELLAVAGNATHDERVQAEADHIEQLAEKYDFEKTYPQPIEERIEAVQREGRPTPFDESGSREQQVKAVTDEQLVELENLFNDMAHLEEAKRQGVDPETGKPPKGKAAEERVKKIDAEIRALDHRVTDAVVAYAEFFGDDAGALLEREAKRRSVEGGPARRAPAEPTSEVGASEPLSVQGAKDAVATAQQRVAAAKAELATQMERRRQSRETQVAAEDRKGMRALIDERKAIGAAIERANSDVEAAEAALEDAESKHEEAAAAANRAAERADREREDTHAAAEAPSISREDEKILRAELNRMRDDGTPPMGAMRYEIFSKRIQGAADGTASAETVEWAKKWLAELESAKKAKDDREAAEHAQTKAQLDADQAALERGEAGNPRYQAYLDTLENPADRNLADYTRFIAGPIEEVRKKNHITGDTPRSLDPQIDAAIRAKADQQLSQRVRKVREEKSPVPAASPYTLAEHPAIARRILAGDITADELKSQFKRLADSEEAVKAELAQKTLKELAPNGTRGATKAQVINSIYGNLLQRFNVKGSYTWNPLSEKPKQAIARQVEGTTDDDIKAYVERRRKALEDRERMYTNPQTLYDFHAFIELRGKDALTPEQLARYDELVAEDNRKQAQREAEKKATVQKVETGDVGMTLTETKHTQKGHDLFVVRLDRRVEGETFKALNTAAKRLGGYYSSYAKDGAVPGFQFKTREDAERFMKVREEDVSRAPIAERREEEVKGNAVERLRDMADRMTAEAEESLGADRKVNTARRATMAAGAEAAANANKALATTMRNIADAIERGDAKHLDAIRTRADVETLGKMLNRARYQWAREQSKAGAGRTEDLIEKPVTAEMVDKAEYPYPFAHRENAEEIAKAVLMRPGFKMAARRILKRAEAAKAADRWQIQATNLAEQEDLREVAKEALKVDRAKYTAEGVLDSFSDYQRLQRMGLVDLPTLRASLREFLQYRGSAAKADPIKAAERALVGRKIPGYFPTPGALAERVVDEAHIQPGMSVLEPSAGKGDIADRAAQVADKGAVSVIEPVGDLRTILEAKGHNVIGRDFLEHDGKYDRIVMNPPFEDRQDVAHVRHAYDLLNPGGRVVAIMSEGPFFGSDKTATEFRDWLDSVGGISEQLPEGSFKDSDRSTGVNTRLVIIDKPETALRQRSGIVSRFLRREQAEPAAPENVGIGADIGRLIKIMGPKLYSSDMPQVTMKELLQNAFDGVKTAYARGVLKRGSGKIDIDYDKDKRILTVRDNGAGMTADTVKNAFITIAGTNKEGLSSQEASGGFGIAKLAFIYGNDGLKLRTVRDGLATMMDTTGEELAAGNARLTQERTRDRDGTTITVTFPKTYRDAKGAQHDLSLPYSADGFHILKKPLVGDVHVRVTDHSSFFGAKPNPKPETLQIGQHLDLSDQPKITTAKFPWGDIDVYLGNKEITERWKVDHAVLSSGIFQFDAHINDRIGFPSEKIPYNIILDVKPNVPADDEFYPFNNQREDWSSKVSGDISALKHYLRLINWSREVVDVGGSYADVQKMLPGEGGARFESANLRHALPSAKSASIEQPPVIHIADGKLNVGGNEIKYGENPNKRENFRVPQAAVPTDAPLFHSNLNVDLVDKAAQKSAIPAARLREFLRRVGEAATTFRDGLGRIPGDTYKAFGDASAEARPAGVSLDKTHAGVNVEVPYKGFFVNPFYGPWVGSLSSPRAKAASVLHTLYHEAVHEKVSGHNQDFTSAIADLYGLFEQHNPGLDEKIKEGLTRTFSELKAEHDALKEVYDDAATKNAEASAGTASKSSGHGGRALDAHRNSGGSARGAQDRFRSEGNAAQTEVGRSAGSTPRVTQQQVYDALRAELDRIGLKDIKLGVTDAIRTRSGEVTANRGRYRALAKAIEVAMRGDVRWTLDHEAVHALRDLGLISRTEWSILSAAALKDKARMDDVRRRYEGRGLSDDELVEEAVADMRADYQENKGATPKGIIQRIFDRIGRFLEAVRNALHGLGFETAEDVFEAIDRGEVGARERQAGVGEREAAAAGSSSDLRQFGIPRDAAEVHTFTSDADIKAHPDYKAAKAGDREAAARLVPDLVTSANIAAAEKAFGSDVTYVPVIAQEATGRNKIPEALAHFYAKETRASVEDGIIQVNKAFHTGAKPMERVLSRPTFDGPVEPGKRYVLVDDVTVLGGSLAELANHIRSNGGQVAGVVTLVNASRSGTFTPKPLFTKLIENRLGKDLRHLGIDPSALTADEAQYLAGFRDADQFRAAVAKAGSSREQRLLSKGVRAPEAPEERVTGQKPGTEPDKFAADDGPAREAYLRDATASLGRDGRPPLGPTVQGISLPFQKDLNAFTRLMIHPRTIAAMYPAFTPVWNTGVAQFAKRDQIAAELIQLKKPYDNLSHHSKEKVNKVLELGRLKGRNFETRPDGSIEVSNDIGHVGEQPGGAALTRLGDTVRLEPWEAHAYRSVRATMDRALDLFRDQVVSDFGFDPAEEGAPITSDIANEMARETQEGRDRENLERLAGVLSEIEDARRTGYVPFTRYGQWAVSVKAGNSGWYAGDHTAGQGETVHREHFEHPIAAKQTPFLSKLARDRAGKAIAGRIAELRQMYPASRGFTVGRIQQITPKLVEEVPSMADLDSLLTAAGLDIGTQRAVEDAVSDLIKRQSFRKHFIQSKNIAGYSTDFERSLADYVTGISGYLARRATRGAFDEALASIPEKQPKLRKYAEAWHDYIESPTEEYSTLRQVGFFYYLAGRFSSAMVNMTQVPVFSMPYMSQFANPVKVNAEIARAYRDVALMATTKNGLTLFDPEKAPADVRADVAAAFKDGTLVPLETFQEMAKAHSRSPKGRETQRKVRTALDVAALAFTAAERINRIVTFIAAARLARDPSVIEKADRVLSKNEVWAQNPEFATPHGFGKWIVDETHYVMGKLNRPTVMRGIGTALLQFKSFTLNTLEMMWRLVAMHQGRAGKLAFLGIVGMLFLSGGLWGEPFAEDLRDLMESLYKAITGKDIDVDRELRELAGGGWAGRALTHGPAREVSGLDISRRVGLGNVLPQPGYGDSALNKLAPFAGIPADLLLMRPLQTGTDLARGDTLSAAIHGSPEAVADVLRALQWQQRGLVSKSSGQKVIDKDFVLPDGTKLSDASNLMKRAIGVQPTGVSRGLEAYSAVQRDAKAADDLKRRYFTEYARTYVQWENATDPGEKKRLEGDLTKIENEVDAHNKTAPDSQQIEFYRQQSGRAVLSLAMRNYIAREEEGALGTQDKRIPKRSREGAEQIKSLY